MKNIAVLVSGGGTNLQAVIDNTLNGYINGRVCVVISNKEGVYALERAKKIRHTGRCGEERGFRQRRGFQRQNSGSAAAL